jgi:hypothetical protein
VTQMTTRNPNAKTLNPEYIKAYRAFHHKGGRRTEPILGVQRRLQALSAIGYSIPALVEATGLSDTTIQSLRKGWQQGANGKPLLRIDKVRAKQIKAAYSLLSVQPCHNTSANRTKTWARKQGWHPPMAWTDIDDPNDRPCGTRYLTTCQYRVNRTKIHREGRACGEGGELRRGMCQKHYRFSMRNGMT